MHGTTPYPVRQDSKVSIDIANKPSRRFEGHDLLG